MNRSPFSPPFRPGLALPGTRTRAPAGAAKRGVRWTGPREHETAVPAAVPAGVALARNANPRAVGEPRRHVDRERVDARVDLLAAARRTPRRPLPAGPSAVRARFRKDHVAARRLDDAAAVAEQAARFGGARAPAGPRPGGA